MGSTIGALIHLGAIFGAIALAIRLTDGRDPITGRNRLGWPKRTGIAIGAVFMTTLLVVPLLRAAGIRPDADDAGNDRRRAEFEDSLREQGAPSAVADCIAAQLPDPVPESVTSNGGALMSLLFECSGVPSDTAECMVDGMAEIVGSLEGETFVRATEALGKNETRALARMGLECRGDVSEAQSVCAVDGLEAEYGSVLFEDVPVLLTGDQQLRLEELLAECGRQEPSGGGATGSDEVCRSVVDATDYDGPDEPDAAAVVRALEEAVSVLRAASATADATGRLELENSALAHQALLPTFVAIDAGLSEFDTAEAEAATALVTATVPLLRSHMLMLPAQNVLVDCDLAIDPPAIVDFMAVAEEFLRTEAALQPAHDGLREFVAQWNEAATRNTGEPTAGFVDAFDQCASAFDAQKPGDDSGCDQLYDACDGRNMLACNDLYWVSAAGSEYEHFAATCGERTDVGGEGFGGFCDELEGP